MAAGIEIDIDAVRAIATAHDRSAAVLEACARMVEQRTKAEGSGPVGYGPIARVLSEWARSTAATAAALAARTDRVAGTDNATASALRDLL